MKTLKSIIFLLFSTSLLSQETIALRNPSFEDIPRCCFAPRGWTPCGKEDLNTPDVQPGFFSVKLKPSNGETYIGLVTRDIDSWESVSQKLNHQILNGKKYWLSIFLAQSPDYLSQSRMTNTDANYNQPIKLRIWGGHDLCNKSELLGESPLIDHEEWREYEFIIESRKNHDVITFEAFYKTPTLVPYNGHILLDQCSDIIEIIGDEEIDNSSISMSKKKYLKENVVLKQEAPSKIYKMTLIKEKIVKGDEVTSEEIHLLLCNEFGNNKIDFDDLESANHYRQILYSGWELENKALEMGFRNFIFNTSNEYVSKMGSNFVLLGFTETGSVINKTVDIISKHDKGDKITEEEYQYFNNSDQLLETIYRNEKTKIDIEDYINENKEKIIKDLQSYFEN